MPRVRCTFTGCTRYARPGQDRCTAHKDAIDRAGRPASAFADRLESGEFRDLFGTLSPKIAQVAADAGLDNEIGVLRLVMARLLAEEGDPARLASGIAKLAGVIVQAQRAQRALSGEAADSLTDAVATILDELNPGVPT
jgi:hypothetical protein